MIEQSVGDIVKMINETLLLSSVLAQTYITATYLKTNHIKQSGMAKLQHKKY